MRNKDNLAKWHRDYYQKRKNDPEYVERKRKSARKYYNNNKEKCAKQRLEYFGKNKDRYRRYRREWRYKSPNGIYGCIKDGAKKRGIEFKISKEDFILWWDAQEKECSYCGVAQEKLNCETHTQNKRSKRLTVDRINNDGMYEINNMVLACYMCNSIKGNYFTESEMKKIGKIISAKRKRIAD